MEPPPPPPEPTTMKLPPVVDRMKKNDNACPICVLVVGMAGSGKTTLINALQQQQQQHHGTMMKENNDNDDNTELAIDDDEEDPDLLDQKKPAAVESTTETTATAVATTDPPPTTEQSSTTTTLENNTVPYVINLDPACLDVPYAPSIDIRDTVDYKQVMQQHRLGPNGAIMTSLNLYATKFDQVISILEKRADAKTLPPFLLVDTPGQIEAFTWSASGQILSESLSTTFPTVLCFVVDTCRCASSPNTFMSNMLYACSIYYRTRLPLMIAFNKTDVVSHEFCQEWMSDFEKFQEALDAARENGDGSGESGFYDSLTRSLSLVLDEFYTEFSKNAVGVSAVTGDGLDEFWATVKRAASEDFEEYLDDLKYRMQEQEAKRKAVARLQAKRLAKDVETDAASK